MRIAIDAGHGLSNRTAGVFDPGACAAGLQEADLTLEYATALRDALVALGLATWMVRSSHADPAPVGKRAARAEKAGCTAFVSLHTNAADSAQARGLEVLYRTEDDLPLARALQRRLVPVSYLADRGVKLRTDLAVLKFRGPAVLIELGFITNQGDRARLVDDVWRRRVVAEIAATIRDVLAPAVPRPAPAPAPETGTAPVESRAWQVEGRMSTFGGPLDTGVKPTEGLALIEPVHLADPKLAALFLPAQPRGTSGLARRLDPEAAYVACRWPYEKLPPAERERWKAHLRRSVARVMSARTGRSIEARPVDWGPNEKTGRVADLSPGLARDLGLKTDDQVIVTVTLP